jgi:thioredoxin-like negative regulator of GroEL
VGSVNAGEYFVSIGAEWCPGCVMVKNSFRSAGIPLTYYDLDEEPFARRWLEGPEIPQTMVVRDGKIVKRFKGGMSVQKVKEFTR